MKAEISSWVKTYHQEADTCSHNEDQDIIVEQTDGGGGPFWRIKTSEWSFNDIEELIELLESAGVQRRAT